ncbi:MAG: hypothetical protein FJ319_03965 [SAR202 cluster bacterium]|nr:hypothetical protein [SAR202 cluster bacterium]
MLRLLKTNKHEKLRELLSSYSDGQVSKDEKAIVEAHLATCSACTAELASLKMTVGLLKGLPQIATLRSFKLEAAPKAVKVSRVPQLMLGLATAGAAAVFMVLVVGDATNAIVQRGELEEAAAAAGAFASDMASKSPAEDGLQGGPGNPGEPNSFEAATIQSPEMAAASPSQLRSSAAAPEAPPEPSPTESGMDIASISPAAPEGTPMPPSFAASAPVDDKTLDSTDPLPASAAQTTGAPDSTAASEAMTGASAAQPAAGSGFAPESPTASGAGVSTELPLTTAAEDTAVTGPTEAQPPVSTGRQAPGDELAGAQPALEDGSGLGLPLRQLQIAVGLALIALMGATAYMFMAGRRRNF